MNEISRVSQAVDYTNKPGENFASIKTFWPTDNIRKFHRIDDEEIIDSTIKILENAPRIIDLVSMDGQIGDTLLIEANVESLTIDKPHNFNEIQTKSFRLFFQNNMDVWTMIEAEVIRNSKYVLTLKRPKSIYQYQSRKYQRVSTPINSSAFYNSGKRILFCGEIKDLSMAGMLICAGNTHKELTTGYTLREINILLPHDMSSSRSHSHSGPHLFNVNNGKVVHSYFDPKTSRTCYGIAFEEAACTLLAEYCSQANHRGKVSHIS